MGSRNVKLVPEPFDQAASSQNEIRASGALRLLTQQPQLARLEDSLGF